MWYFLKKELANEFNFDHSLKDFFERGVEGLVRENLQNSLDAKDMNKEEPVVVHIETGLLKMNEIPEFNILKNHIMSLPAHNEYAQETIENMQTILTKYRPDEQKIPFISFEDSNTTGLNGIPDKENLDVDGSWSAYAYYRGSHHQTEIESKDLVSGGSHGIGKISSNAASSLHLMYFINRNEKGQEHISGNISLIDHALDGEKYTGAGIFTNYVHQDGEIKFYPEINRNEYPFSKETKGLKIIIPFLAPKYNNPEQIVRAICDNFFVAILNGDLEVHLDTLGAITRDTILDFVKNKKYYPNQDRQDMRDDHTPIYVDTYLNHKLEEDFQVNDDYGKTYNFSIYYQKDDNIKSGRFAIVRKIGMTIENRKIPGWTRRGPFSGILIPKDNETDRYLKKLENASHTKLESESIPNKEEAEVAKKFLNNLKKQIIGYIEQTNKEEEGEIEDLDTSDMIYSIENILGKNIQPIENISTTVDGYGVKREFWEEKVEDFSSEDKEGQGLKTPGLISTNKAKKETKKEKEKRERKKQEERKKYRDRQKKGENTILKSSEDSEAYTRTALVTSNVKRAQVEDRELILLLTADSIDENIKESNIYFSRIDGDGEREKEIFDLASNFEKIIDKNTNQKLKCSKNKIRNASIKDGKIYIEMLFKPAYNKDCKFNVNLEYKK